MALKGISKKTLLSKKHRDDRKSIFQSKLSFNYAFAFVEQEVWFFVTSSARFPSQNSPREKSFEKMTFMPLRQRKYRHRFRLTLYIHWRAKAHWFLVQPRGFMATTEHAIVISNAIRFSWNCYLGHVMVLLHECIMALCKWVLNSYCLWLTHLPVT